MLFELQSGLQVEQLVQIDAADEFVAGLLPVVLAIRNTGAHTLEAISCALNSAGESDTLVSNH